MIRKRCSAWKVEHTYTQGSRDPSLAYQFQWFVNNRRRCCPTRPVGRAAKRSLAIAAAAVGRNFTGGDNYHLVEYREALKQSGERARAYTESSWSAY